MPQFSYRARRRSGEVVRGVLDVADRSAALAQIERLGLFPVAVEAPKSGNGAVGRKREINISLGSLLPAGVRGLLRRQRKPKLQELATFTQQLGNLLNAGMPLTLALKVGPRAGSAIHGWRNGHAWTCQLGGSSVHSLRPRPVRQV